ncbi:MAG: ATP-binding protein [Candidatus Aenigmarchaeota archaeon]|nr:ATP-binding protein [Candidatus Aenigmarchaeota archaeon]
MGELLGTVISKDTNPNSSEFAFVITNNKARKGQFVMLDTAEGKMIARISDIIKTNRYFERAESVQEFERAGKSLTELFPADRWEYLVGEAVTLGVYSEEKLMRSSFPASPGTKVHMAENDILSNFFGLDGNKGLEIGKVEYHDLPVKINMTKLFQKHLAILAMSGAGKSYLTSVLMEELMERQAEHGQMAVIVIDTHGEYVGFAEDPKYRDNADIVLGKDFKIGVPHISANTIAQFIPSMSSVQKRELTRLLSSMYAEKKGQTFNLKDVLDYIDESDTKSTTKGILYTLLLSLHQTRLFGNYDNPPLDKIAKPGHMTIIDISDMVNLRNKQMVVTYLSTKLFEARRANKIPPYVLVIEEAHNFAPEGIRAEGAISKRIIEKIAREGRKFNSCLCLISQRPINLSTTALSQCNTHMILRVNNPYDLKHIGESSEGVTSDVLKTISSLRVGEALIVGEAVNYPLFLKVRKRKSKKNERGTALEEACLNFRKQEKLKDEDLQAFI